MMSLQARGRHAVVAAVKWALERDKARAVGEGACGGGFIV